MKALYQQHPEMSPASLGPGSPELDRCKVQKCAVVWQVHISNSFLEIMDVVSSGPKWKRSILIVISAKFKSQHLWWSGGGVSAHGMSNLHICKGNINAERYMEQHMLPSKQRLFQGRHYLFQRDNAKPLSACVTTAWLHSKIVWVLDWPACSPDLSPIESEAHYEVQNTTVESLDCWATEVMYQARMGKNSTYNTLTISVLSSQTVIDCC